MIRFLLGLVAGVALWTAVLLGYNAYRQALPGPRPEPAVLNPVPSQPSPTEGSAQILMHASGPLPSPVAAPPLPQAAAGVRPVHPSPVPARLPGAAYPGQPIAPAAESRRPMPAPLDTMQGGGRVPPRAPGATDR